MIETTSIIFDDTSSSPTKFYVSKVIPNGNQHFIYVKGEYIALLRVQSSTKNVTLTYYSCTDEVSSVSSIKKKISRGEYEYEGTRSSNAVLDEIVFVFGLDTKIDGLHMCTLHIS